MTGCQVIRAKNRVLVLRVVAARSGQGGRYRRETLHFPSFCGQGIISESGFDTKRSM